MLRKPIPSALPLSASDSRKGFTLLELMISIAVIGIIILIISSAMRLSFRSVDVGERKIESLERMRSSLTIIECQIQSEIPLTHNDDMGSRKYSFKGEQTSLEFPTNYSIWGGEKGYVTVDYRVDSDSNGKKVLYASENMIGVESGGEVKLLDGYDDIYFEYFYKGPTEEKGKWVEKWTEETSIPEKIRLHLIAGTKDYALIIPMRTRASLAQAAIASSGFGPFPGR